MKGIYCLYITISKNFKTKVGKLGTITFEKGKYVYVGSAMNSLEGRIKRHLRTEKKIHWHIDYLLLNKNAKIEKVFFKECENKKEECLLAAKIRKISRPIPKFGCSDCNCNSHLFKVENFYFNKYKLKEFL